MIIDITIFIKISINNFIIIYFRIVSKKKLMILFFKIDFRINNLLDILN